MALSLQNRAPSNRLLAWLFLYASGMFLLMRTTLLVEFLGRWGMHRSQFHVICAASFPFLLAAGARASTLRWPATAMAAVYTVFNAVLVWVLPLFEGHPRLEPIYVHVDRFVPPDFPLLLIVPAIGIDVVMRNAGRGRDWKLAAAVGIAFVVLFAPAQWLFADFLVSPLARNWFFGSHYMPYMVRPAAQARWFQLLPPDNIAFGLSVATVVAFITARVGLLFGNWMTRVQR
jgi:hypothetical protein